MLFLLTGNVQIGKSRWLERCVDRLKACGIASYGVLAPGIWVTSEGPHANDQGFEKLGINNVLLPQKETVPFALRCDIARNKGMFCKDSQSAKAHLAWEISDDAIDAVNRHFTSFSAAFIPEPSLLVVDELGRLELANENGLTSALRLLDGGPAEQFPHAVVVVRKDLLPCAVDRFANSWSVIQEIAPDEQGFESILAAFGL